MPPIPGNICTYTSVQQKEDAFTASPFLFLPHYRGSLTIIINKCTQSELEHQTGLEHVEVLVILELVTVKTIVSVAQHYLGKLVERVVYT